MVCPCDSRRTSVGQGRRDALVRRNPPALPGGLVDRPAHDRVPEPEPSWHVGVCDELHSGELVDRVQHVGLGEVGGCGSEIYLERIAGDRGAVQHATNGVGEQRQLLGKRGGHHRWYLHSGEGYLAPSAGRERVSAGSGQLLEVERISAGLFIEELGVLTQAAPASHRASAAAARPVPARRPGARGLAR